MTRKFAALLLLALCLAGSMRVSHASTIPNIDGDYKALMQKAVKEGKAAAWVSGQVADYIREQIKRPEAKILLEVTRVDDHGKKGCHGLKLRFTTPGTLLPMSDGVSRELDMSSFMNMCPK
jgi:hypothetical protein